MLTKTWDTTADSTVALLARYIFDLGGYSARELAEYWRSAYPDSWVHLAVIEALYQGRYKAVSVEQILAFWQRRGQALPHFNYEFERLVCSNIQSRLNRQSPPHPSAKPYTRSLEPSAYSSNSTHSPGRKKSNTSCIQTVPVQVLDNQFVQATNNLNTAYSHSQLRQSHKTYNSPMRSVPAALPSSVNQQPIRQFHPQTSKSSEFYTKLKAICQHN